MKNIDIKEVLLGLSDDSPYLAAIHQRYFPGKAKLSPAERLVYPISDPAFGWHFTTSYFRAGQALPLEVNWPSVRQALSCLKGDNPGQDRACHDAISIGSPAKRNGQLLIKALLCSELDYEGIANCCGISGETVEFFAHLFFDFPERKDDLRFVSRILNPRSELKMFNQRNAQSQDRCLMLMNLGYQLGSAAVLNSLGLSTRQEDLRSDGEILRNATRSVLSRAETKAQLGLLTPGDVEFHLVKTLAAEGAKHHPDLIDDDARMGLTRLSMDQGAMLVFKRIVTATAEERMRNARIYDEQTAAADARRRAADPGAPGKSPRRPRSQAWIFDSRRAK